MRDLRVSRSTMAIALLAGAVVRTLVREASGPHRPVLNFSFERLLLATSPSALTPAFVVDCAAVVAVAFLAACRMRDAGAKTRFGWLIATPLAGPGFIPALLVLPTSTEPPMADPYRSTMAPERPSNKVVRILGCGRQAYWLTVGAATMAGALAAMTSGQSAPPSLQGVAITLLPPLVIGLVVGMLGFLERPSERLPIAQRAFTIALMALTVIDLQAIVPPPHAMLGYIVGVVLTVLLGAALAAVSAPVGRWIARKWIHVELASSEPS